MKPILDSLDEKHVEQTPAFEEDKKVPVISAESQAPKLNGSSSFTQLKK